MFLCDRQADREAHVEHRKWFKTLSDLRGKERSLLHGEYHTLGSTASALAYVRLWDQSDRYVVVVNWGSAPAKLTLKSTGTNQSRQSFLLWFCFVLFSFSCCP